MALTSNPPWISRALRANWDDLVAVVGPEAMPRRAAGLDASDAFEPEEYGTGHYGTVMPTGVPDLVCKITSDPAEALFVGCALTLGEFPVGIVRYNRIIALNEQYRGRPVFAIWRQEANDVGFLTKQVKLDHYEQRQRKEATSLILNTKIAGSMVREAVESRGPKAITDAAKLERWAFDWAGAYTEELERDPYVEAVFRGGNLQSQHKTIEKLLKEQRGAYRVAGAIRLFEMGAEMMRHNNPITTTIGEAFEFYLENGILLADVHLNNIGIVKHEDYDDGMVAITDPGHAVLLDKRYESMRILTAREAHAATA